MALFHKACVPFRARSGGKSQGFTVTHGHPHTP